MKELNDTDLMPETVYALRGEDGVTRYIGKTSKPLCHRLNKHLRDARSGNRGHRNNWIRSVLRSGTVPSILPIESGANGSALEIKWISHLRSMGWPLVNATDGGEGTTGIKLSLEHRKNLSLALTGKKRSESTRALIRSARAKQPPPHTSTHSEAAKIKMRLALSGAVVRRKIGMANKGKPPVKLGMKRI